MNKGKICISICAKTSKELLEKFELAVPLADVIEVRFDCFDKDEIDIVLDNLPEITKSYLFVYRPKEQGGNQNIDKDEQIRFWSRVQTKMLRHNYLVDYEFDMDFPLELDAGTTIVSMHDFKGVSKDLSFQHEMLSEMSGKTLKIAVQADSITDTIPVWNLLDKAKQDGKSIIPIAMGEAGKWTRILGLAHGAFMTYASLGAGDETAPGQISASDMIDVFRVRELDEKTEVYGIVAGDTSYSASPWMLNAAFKSSGLNKVFIPLQVTDLDEFLRRMVKPDTREIELNFQGFSVTNPHKQAIMRHLDVIDETAAKIGAVNTVKIEDDKLYGCNTDAQGFMAPLKSAFSDIKNANVAVIGAGGAARACVYALQQEGAKATLLVRNPKKTCGLEKDFGIHIEQFEISNFKSRISDFDILVNATPLGTKGRNEDKSVAAAEQLKGLKLVYDLVYNPLETRLIREAKSAGVPYIGGLEMLVAQGVKQFEIWTGKEPSVEKMRLAVKQKLGL